LTTPNIFDPLYGYVVAYLQYGSHGSCHGRHVDRGAKIAR